MNSDFLNAITFKFNQINRMSKNPITAELTSETVSQMMRNKDRMMVDAVKYAISLGLKP